MAHAPRREIAAAYVKLEVSASVGAWLSLVERLVRDQEAGGSNPIAPTNYPSRFHDTTAA